MYSDGLLKLPIFTIQKNFKILLTVYSLSPHFIVCFLSIFLRILLLRDLPLRIIRYGIPHLNGISHIVGFLENTLILDQSSIHHVCCIYFSLLFLSIRFFNSNNFKLPLIKPSRGILLVNYLSSPVYLY